MHQALSFIHPRDSRPVFLFPWEGSTVLGTTDVDHDHDMEKEPFVTMVEADYLMEGLKYILPDFNLSLEDCISSIAGVRPVLSRKDKTAHKESREHAVWKKRGLITVTGGKLTTFQILANDALKAAQSCISKKPGLDHEREIEKLRPGKIWKNMPENLQERLVGRYGIAGCNRMMQYDEKLCKPVENTNSIWAEILYSAEHEDICHLSDLLLRRVRVGLLLPGGGINILDRVESLCRPYLYQNNKKWDKRKWDREKREYMKLWKTFYSPPSAKQE